MRKILCIIALLSTTYVNAFEVDSVVGLKANFSRDYKLLTHDVCEGLASEKMRANAIYNWITHNIAFDIIATDDPERDPPEIKEVLNKKMATPDGYTLLFTEMCKEAGIPAIAISGYAKGWIFDDGDTLVMPRGNWCAVQIDGNWQFADPVMGAGYISYYSSWGRKQLAKLGQLSKRDLQFGNKKEFVPNYDPSYFMPNHISFRETHLPMDPVWQMSNPPMPKYVFEGGDSMVQDFNSKHNVVINQNPRLLNISNLNEGEYILEYADRVYQFNPQLPTVLSQKEYVKSNKLLGDGNNVTKQQLAEMQNSIKKSLEYLKMQRQLIKPHYSVLQKKNVAKNQEFKAMLRHISQTNKQTVNRINRMHSVGEIMVAGFDRTIAELEKQKAINGFNKLNNLQAAGLKDSTAYAAASKLKDSVHNRADRIVIILDQIDSGKQRIEKLLDDSKYLTLNLLPTVHNADSLLLTEQLSRNSMSDQGEADVKRTSTAYKQLKFTDMAGLQDALFDRHDSMCKIEKQLVDMYDQLISTYKTNIREIEMLNRTGGMDDEISDLYTKCMLAYGHMLDWYHDELSSYKMVHGNWEKSLGWYLNTLNKEIKTTEEMEFVETKRKDEEALELTKNQNFDERENDKHQRRMRSQLDEIESLLKR